MKITICINDKPVPPSECHSEVVVDNWDEAKVYLWALAKSKKPEYAYAFSDSGIEGMDNNRLKDLEVPFVHKKAVSEMVDNFNKIDDDSMIESTVSDALDQKMDDLIDLIGVPDFAEKVAEAAEEWALTLKQNIERSSGENECHTFVRMIARLDTEEDFENRGSCMESDDAVDTVNRLISEARLLIHRTDWDDEDTVSK